MIYVLSFVEVGIYWVNHHYLIDDVKQVSHALLWANLGFLFILSLIPFGTAWVGERGLTPFALSLYLVCCAPSAISWIVLAVVVRQRTHTSLADSPIKQAVSVIVYLGVIPVSYHSVAMAMVMLGAVAVLWLIPPQRVLKVPRS
ncbi:TMEM175 family protein [Tunturiibacter gelidoferens]|uniref:Membrane protein n=1 Tax=Tunturiibacter gelidiferens TaxID=3069689 RepID=A0A9X0QCL1_9BACT|nr:TMEM175 family protein [Edaphobacter lichenicola]MBB5327932.1 putative membrane protein [Edaphobacter lichenicola]